MFAYNTRLAWLSIRRNPVISSLMVAAVGIGIGVCMTMLSIYHVMSGDPIPEKSDVLYRVQFDAWDPAEPWGMGEDGPDAPTLMTYTDAVALMESDIATHQSAMYRSYMTVQPENKDLAPETRGVRAAYRDFFPMFAVPFLYGGPWSVEADEGNDNVVVIGRAFNEEHFGGVDSIGREITFSGEIYRVVGVIDHWNPLPKFYHLNNGNFQDAESVYMPFRLAINKQMPVSGNTSCWKPEPIEGFSGFLGSECVWVQYWAELGDESERLAYMDYMNGYAAQQQELGRFGRADNNKVTDVMAWMDKRGVVSDDSVVLVGMSFLFLAVCLLNTIGLLLAKFAGASPMVGLRRALGADKLTIFRQYLVEVGAVGLAGGLLGLGLAVLGLFTVRNWYEDYEKVAQLDGVMVATTIILSVIATVVAGLYPAWRLCRIAPARYLKTQ
jgi:putative ABC transport system permease protein